MPPQKNEGQTIWTDGLPLEGNSLSDAIPSNLEREANAQLDHSRKVRLGSYLAEGR
jgi:hypothetical protein